MAVYIKPPKGDISFNKLCEFVKKRILFLHFLNGKSSEEITQGIIENGLASDSDCLIEGTAKDRISHFVLRCLCLGHHEMERFFVQTETQYFQYRLEFYDFPGITNIVNSASKEILKVLQSQHIIKSYKKVLHDFLHVASEFESAMKNKSNMKIPFTTALQFVQDRTFPLQYGFIEVPLEFAKRVLVLIFENVIYQGLQQMKFSPLSQVLKDPRMHYMHKEVKKWFCANRTSPYVTFKKEIVLERHLSLESKKFPLCMKNLYNILCKNHRLPHSSRVQFILFLKEIGVPVHEVIALFMKEYSFPLEKIGNNSCLHTWEKDKHRYIYSIEHLYGQRGAKKNYSAHSCKSLQSFTNCGSDGGCPFIHFKDMRDSSPCSFEIEDIEDIKLLATEKNYTKACQLYMFKYFQSNANLQKQFSSNQSCCSRFSDNNSDEINLMKSVSKDLFLKTMIAKPSDVFFLLSDSRIKYFKDKLDLDQT